MQRRGWRRPAGVSMLSMQRAANALVGHASRLYASPRSSGELQVARGVVAGGMAAELGDGVWLLQECTLADHSRIRWVRCVQVV